MSREKRKNDGTGDLAGSVGLGGTAPKPTPAPAPSPTAEPTGTRPTFTPYAEGTPDQPPRPEQDIINFAETLAHETVYNASQSETDALRVHLRNDIDAGLTQPTRLGVRRWYRLHGSDYSDEISVDALVDRGYSEDEAAAWVDASIDAENFDIFNSSFADSYGELSVKRLEDEGHLGDFIEDEA